MSNELARKEFEATMRRIVAVRRRYGLLGSGDAQEAARKSAQKMIQQTKVKAAKVA